MTLPENAKSIVLSDNLAVIKQTAANDTNDHKDTNDYKDTDVNVSDNGINLATIFEPYFRPDENTIVCGALDDEKVAALAAAGVELVLNLQPDDELSFDERAAVERAGMHYEQLPISGTQAFAG